MFLKMVHKPILISALSSFTFLVHPGPPFQIRYNYVEKSYAINQTTGGFLTGIFYQALQDLGFQVSPGSSNQKTASVGDTVTGTTTG
jgi:hypothetical protein